jgi:hypothetical protein
MLTLILTNHLGTVLTVLVFALMWWRKGDRVLEFLSKLERSYDRAHKFAEEKKLYELAQKAFGYVNELSARTETKLDDKAAKGLGWMLKAMKYAGLDATSETEDLIKGYFNQLHDAERTAKELRGSLLPLPPGEEVPPPSSDAE